MANRVVVTICGEDYTFVAEESTSYMQKVGAYVGDKMNEILNTAKVGRTDAAVLTAANIADELFKSQAAAEQLRGQIKGYLDEAGKAQAEVSELKREIFRLQQRLDSRGKCAGRSSSPPPGLRRRCAPPSSRVRTRSIWGSAASTPGAAPGTSRRRTSRPPAGTATGGASGSS